MAEFPVVKQTHGWNTLEPRHLLSRLRLALKANSHVILEASRTMEDLEIISFSTTYGIELKLKMIVCQSAPVFL